MEATLFNLFVLAVAKTEESTQAKDNENYQRRRRAL